MISDHKKDLIMKISLHLTTDQKVGYSMSVVGSQIHL